MFIPDRNVRSSASVPPLRFVENDDSVHDVCVCVCVRARAMLIQLVPLLYGYSHACPSNASQLPLASPVWFLAAAAAAVSLDAAAAANAKSIR